MIFSVPIATPGNTLVNKTTCHLTLQRADALYPNLPAVADLAVGTAPVAAAVEVTRARSIGGSSMNSRTDAGKR